MNIIKAFFELINQPDIDTVIAYQYKMPSNIEVQITADKEIFFAKVKKINDEDLLNTTVITEAESIDDLVVSVNDAILTYLDFPENIKTRMPLLIPPQMAEKQLHAMQGAKHKDLVFAK